MYSSEIVANYFIKKGIREGNYITLMKVNKLVYYAHGWYLALTGEPLVNEYVQARDFGITFPILRNDYSKYLGADPIRSSLERFESKTQGFVPVEDITDSQDIKLLDRIWEIFGKLSDVQLSSMTIADGTPWSKMDLTLKWPIIPNHYIEEYFYLLIEKNDVLDDYKQMLDDRNEESY